MERLRWNFRRSLENWKGALIFASVLDTLLDGSADVMVTYTLLHQCLGSSIRGVSLHQCLGSSIRGASISFKHSHGVKGWEEQ
jgi:hypothetical protein